MDDSRSAQSVLLSLAEQTPNALYSCSPTWEQQRRYFIIFFLARAALDIGTGDKR
jgi:hypothetical protein